MAPVKIKWSEVLEAAGEPAGACAAAVKAEEARLQSEVAAYEKSHKREANHDKNGLTEPQVLALVKRHLSPSAFDFCGQRYAAELWDAL